MSDTATALTTSPEQTPVRERPIGADPRQSPPPRANEPDLPLLDFTCRMVSQPAEMLEQLPAWRRLAEVALEPNVFLEDWFLLPAWQHLAQEQCVELLLIEAPKRVYPEGPRVLCGLMPIVRKRAFRGLPLRVWELWKHPYCFLGTPLLRRDCARQVLDHVITYARQSQPGATMVHFPMVTGDGPFHRLLVESNHDHQRTCFVKDQHTRAQFTAAEDAESF